MTFLWATGSDDLLKEVKLKLGGGLRTPSAEIQKLEKKFQVFYIKKIQNPKFKSQNLEPVKKLTFFNNMDENKQDSIKTQALGY